jgi:hypothetical protein
VSVYVPDAPARRRPLVTQPKPAPGWARFGRFSTTTVREHVVCGVCLAQLTDPKAKAEHLRIIHGARIRTTVDAYGILLYEWNRG